jgi:hypothetical protein
MIREEVWEIIKDSRSSGQVLLALNVTFLALIPKEGQISHPMEFWLIALCNVIYKLLTKVIARRLKPILPGIISLEQLGYVEGRKIMDSVILAHEVIHSLQKTRMPGMILKLDLSKAFDKLSWDYMCAILLAFGFDHLWVEWILNLTSSAFFSILVNGVPSHPFSPSRGIRQGDPLSPFLRRATQGTSAHRTFSSYSARRTEKSLLIPYREFSTPTTTLQLTSLNDREINAALFSL